LLRRFGYAFQARRVIGIASDAQQQLADLMGHHLLHHESGLRCIEAQGTGQTMPDPIKCWAMAALRASSRCLLSAIDGRPSRQVAGMAGEAALLDWGSAGVIVLLEWPTAAVTPTRLWANTSTSARDNIPVPATSLR